MQTYESTIIEPSCYDSFMERISNSVEDSYFIQNIKDNFLDKSFEKEMYSVFPEMKDIQSLENFEYFVEEISEEEYKHLKKYDYLGNIIL